MDEVRALLKAPANLDAVGIVPFGYPARPVGRGRKQRKPLREIAHRERYGQPFVADP
jgi:nitroreductase